MYPDRGLSYKKLTCALMIAGVILVAILTAGCVLGNVGEDSYSGTWLIKLDSDGHMSWKKFFANNYLQPLASTGNGGLLITGHNGYNTISKMDGSGEFLWERSYNETMPWPISSLSQVSDNSYIAMNEDGVIIKIDSNGNLIWHKNDDLNTRLWGLSAISASDSGFVTASDDNTVIWLDGDGNIIHRVALRQASSTIPLLHTIDGGDCIIAYCSELNKSKVMHIARLNSTGYVWNMSRTDYAPAFLNESPDGRLCLAYGDARIINSNGKILNEPDSNKVPLKIMTLSDNGVIESDRNITVKSPYTPSGDGGFIYAEFSTGTNGESVVWPGTHEKLTDVRIVRLDSAGDERWNATVEMGDVRYKDNPAVIMRMVESVTTTDDGGCVVLVNTRKMA